MIGDYCPHIYWAHWPLNHLLTKESDDQAFIIQVYTLCVIVSKQKQNWIAFSPRPRVNIPKKDNSKIQKSFLCSSHESYDCM